MLTTSLSNNQKPSPPPSFLNMHLDLDLQMEVSHLSTPTVDDFFRWVMLALQRHALAKHYELAIRLVDEVEARALNSQWRQRDYATNVLSFPCEVPSCITPTPLGDIVICAPVVLHEAKTQNKAETAHWAHLTLHGVLHLLGFDHLEEADAQIMEQAEIILLQELGYPNPYLA